MDARRDRAHGGGVVGYRVLAVDDPMMDCPRKADEPKPTLRRWWRYAVLRGPGIPAEMNGRWFDMDSMPTYVHPIGPFPGYSDAQCVPTDRWEQRDDGQVAVVYEWTRS